MPALLKAWDALPAGDPLKTKLAEQIALLRDWDFRWARDSVPTSLAVFWGEDVAARRRRRARRGGSAYEYAAPRRSAAAGARDGVRQARRRLRHAGRRRGATSTASSASPATSCSRSTTPGRASRWLHVGALGLARVVRRARVSGHEEDGTARAATASSPSSSSATACARKAVTAGGESGDPKSPHFNDQAERYATGNLREVYFYPRAAQGAHRARVPPGEMRT